MPETHARSLAVFMAIDEFDPHGGATRLMVSVARQLRAQGVTVRIFVESRPPRSNQYARDLRAAAIPVVDGEGPLRLMEGLTARVGLLGRVRPLGGRILPPYRIMTARVILAALRARLAGRRTVIHVARGAWGLELARRRGLPSVYVENSTPTRGFGVDGQWEAVRETVPLADVVAASSVKSVAATRAYFGTLGPCRALPWIVEAPDGRLEPARSHAGAPLVVGTAGRLSPEKGHAWLIRAIPRVLAEVPARFVIAGDGECRGELAALAAGLGVEEHVELVGEQGQAGMAAFWSRLDVCVVPSLLEGTPLVALEAMARGIPVVATDVGGVSELLAGGENGRLVPPADEVKLAEAIVELVCDPRERQRLGAAGRRRVAERHSGLSAVTPWLEVYAEACDSARGANRQRGRARPARPTRGGPCPILLYHRLAAPSRDPHGHGVTLCHFAEHMEVIRRVAHPMSLPAVLAGYRSGTLPERAIAVTFDDGYANTLLEALPVLERFDVPAAVHVVTGAIGRELWWDELEAIVLGPASLPPVLRVTIASTPYNWATHDSADARLEMLAGLHRLLRTVTSAERERVLAALAESCGIPRPSPRSSHRTLTVDELGVLARSSLIELGAHTVSHPALAGLPREVQAAEVRDSKHQLEAWLGRPVTLFAYPCWPWSCDDASLDAVRAAGFAFAVTVHPRAIRYGTDPLLVPRLSAVDEDGDAFERHLRSLFDS